ncbi:MAG: DUF4173 domain-containing protein [Gemmatimonadetes bacterium]|nr:DUF4173 domain-containing protein [Gemmatimonadota bacterium]
MTTRTDALAQHPGPGALAPTRAAIKVRPDAPATRTLLWQAALLGLSADALLHDTLVGPALAIWVVVLALAALALTWSAGRRVPKEAFVWFCVAVALAALTAWRDSGALQFLDLLATIAALGFAAVSLRDPELALLAPRLRDTLWAGLAVVLSAIRGIVPLAVRELFAAERQPGWQGRYRTAARLALISGSLLLVFGSLLRSADPIFEQLVALPDFDVGLVVSHVFVTGFFAWTAGGWAYAALVESPARGRAPERFPLALGAADLTTALGTLTVLFGVYVLAQLGWFFGGERFLRETTGLTAAEYARRGFFQMVVVVALVVPLLLATRALLRPDPALARRHTLLSLPVVGLLGAIIASAALRMRLYVHYYGLTTDRLYTLVFMGWLAIVLVLLTATVLRGRGRLFVAGSAVSALGLLGALHVVVPDVIVATVNIQRAAHSPRAADSALDLRHLASLSGEAARLATNAVLAPMPRAQVNAVEWNEQRCDASSTLLEHWGPASRTVMKRNRDGAWRWWNAGESEALREVGANASALRRVRHESCAPRWAARRAAAETR